MNNRTNWNVLVVDDEPDNCGVLELIFSFHQTRFRSAESGVECLRLMEEDAPSLLLVDIQMPGMDGYELLNQVRTDARWSEIVIVAVTAHAMSGDAEQALLAGFDGYIPKPINATLIVSELGDIIEGKKVKWQQ